MTTPAAGEPAGAPPAGPSTASGERLFYVDDSGAEDTGFVVYSWIECTVPNWHGGLRAWLDLRKSLYAQYQIPPSAELHATKFISGRGNPSQDPGVNMSKRTAETPPSRRWRPSTRALSCTSAYRETPARTKARRRSSSASAERSVSQSLRRS